MNRWRYWLGAWIGRRTIYGQLIHLLLTRSKRDQNTVGAKAKVLFLQSKQGGYMVSWGLGGRSNQINQASRLGNDGWLLAQIVHRLPTYLALPFPFSAVSLPLLLPLHFVPAASIPTAAPAPCRACQASPPPNLPPKISPPARHPPLPPANLDAATPSPSGFCPRRAPTRRASHHSFPRPLNAKTAIRVGHR
jgi:hypothetical protein